LNAHVRGIRSKDLFVDASNSRMEMVCPNYKDTEQNPTISKRKYRERAVNHFATMLYFTNHLELNVLK
jgi:hypothetical protein